MIKNIQNNNNKRTGCTTSSNTQQNIISFYELINDTKSMSKNEIKIRIKQLQAKYFNSMVEDELWEITREILYLKIALGLMKKHRKNNLNKLVGERIQFDCEFIFKTGRVYPNGVSVYKDNYTNAALVIKDFIAEISPFLNGAEQMLFKLTFSEQSFVNLSLLKENIAFSLLSRYGCDLSHVAVD
jgi:hypothetical protein